MREHPLSSSLPPSDSPWPERRRPGPCSYVDTALPACPRGAFLSTLCPLGSGHRAFLSSFLLSSVSDTVEAHSDPTKATVTGAALPPGGSPAHPPPPKAQWPRGNNDQPWALTQLHVCNGRELQSFEPQFSNSNIEITIHISHGCWVT